jgi:hypothetical protein
LKGDQRLWKPKCENRLYTILGIDRESVNYQFIKISHIIGNIIFSVKTICFPSSKSLIQPANKMNYFNFPSLIRFLLPTVHHRLLTFITRFLVECLRHRDHPFPHIFINHISGCQVPCVRCIKLPRTYLFFWFFGNIGFSTLSVEN